MGRLTVPWMELLIVIGIMAQAAVLQALLAIGGARLLVAVVVLAVCFVGPALHRFRSTGRTDDGWQNDIFGALVFTPPIALVIELLLGLIWPH